MAVSWVSQNPILRVRFEGWESDTYILGQCGWSVGLTEDPRDRDLIVLLRHSGLRLAAQGILRDWRRLKEMMVYGLRTPNSMPSSLPPIEIQSMGTIDNLIVRGSIEPYRSMKWVDTEPMYSQIDLQEFRFSDIPLFAEKGTTPAQELIIEPQDVQMVLDHILRAQAPGMKDIRARNAKRERDQPEQKQVHAQIISLNAA